MSHWLLLCTLLLLMAGFSFQKPTISKRMVPPDSATYQERYRPHYHFTPPKNWIIDPNGLVYYKGEYHLFYQYNPFGTKWGHMSWGHAVSKDLLHWQHLPVAIPEDASGFMIFSGTVVVDTDNTSGLSESKNPSDHSCLVAIYTADYGSKKIQRQHLAYSNDRGRTWKQYAANPVLDINKKDFRDPKVFRYGNRWLMVLVLPTEHKVSFYESANLTQWTHLSDFGPEGKTDEIWECPDMYELPVAGKPGIKKWVLQLSTQHSMQYFIGDFDGRTFKNDNPANLILPYDFGPDMYAAITYNNLPTLTGRRISIGWMNSWQYAGEIPTDPWRGAMTIPRMHSLKAYPEGIRLVQQPINEITRLRTQTISVKNMTMKQVNDMIRRQKANSRSADIVIEMEPKQAGEMGLLVRKGKDEQTKIGFQVADSVVFVDRTQSGATSFHEKFPGRYTAPFTPRQGKIKLRILVDGSSVEVFVGDGQKTITCQVYPDPKSDGIELYTDTGDIQVHSLTIYELRSVWEEPRKSAEKPVQKEKKMEKQKGKKKEK